MQLLRFVLLGIFIAAAAVFGWRMAGSPGLDLASSRSGTSPAAQPAPATQKTALKPPAPAVPAAPKPEKVAAVTPPAKPPPALPRMPVDQARNDVRAKIMAAEEFAGFLAKFQRVFPARYNKVMDNFAERASRNGRIENADLYLAEALRALRASHGVLASRASGDTLEKLFTLQARTLAELAQKNPSLCADFLYGSANANFFAFSASHRKLIGEMADTALAAIIDGRTSKIDRPAPTEQDFKDLETELGGKGLGKPEIDMLLDGKAANPPLSDAVICKAGAIYFQTLRAMPEDARMRIYSLAIKMLARS